MWLITTISVLIWDLILGINFGNIDWKLNLNIWLSKVGLYCDSQLSNIALCFGMIAYCYIVLELLQDKTLNTYKIILLCSFLNELNQLEFDSLLINMLFTQQTLVQIYGLFREDNSKAFGGHMVLWWFIVYVILRSQGSHSADCIIGSQITRIFLGFEYPLYSYQHSLLPLKMTIFTKSHEIWSHL